MLGPGDTVTHEIDTCPVIKEPVLWRLTRKEMIVLARDTELELPVGHCTCDAAVTQDRPGPALVLSWGPQSTEGPVGLQLACV